MIYFGQYLEQEKMARHLLWDQMTIEVESEDFLRDPGVGIQRICEHLGYQGNDLATVTYRQNTYELSEVIENIDEVAEVLLNCTITERFGDYFRERRMEPTNANMGR